MRNLLIAVLALFAVDYANADSEKSHCSLSEQTYFNCRVRGSDKVASVCGSGYNEEQKTSGYLQYRFGSMGKLEMVYPPQAKADEMQDRFTFSASRNSSYSQYDLELQFTNLGYAYAIHSSETHKQEAVSYSSSMTVWRLNDPCKINCPRFASPKRELVQVFSCTNGDAGRNLYLDRVVRLMTSPGMSSANRF
jgi:hypothetical protein